MTTPSSSALSGRNLHSILGKHPEALTKYTDLNEYWSKRKRIEKYLRNIHPLYRYPRSPYSNIEKRVLLAKSTERIAELALPKVRSTVNMLNEDQRSYYSNSKLSYGTHSCTAYSGISGYTSSMRTPSTLRGSPNSRTPSVLRTSSLRVRIEPNK